MYQFVIDSPDLQPYLEGVRPLEELEPRLAVQVADLCDWQALYTPTRPPAATFADLDPRSQAIYRALAAAFPDCTLYATGSRVRGHWRSGHPDDPKTAIAARLGKSLESDVDVVVVTASGASLAVKHFRAAVAPIVAVFGVKIDQQPPTIMPLVASPSAELTHVTAAVAVGKE